MMWMLAGSVFAEDSSALSSMLAERANEAVETVHHLQNSRGQQDVSKSLQDVFNHADDADNHEIKSWWDSFFSK